MTDLSIIVLNYNTKDITLQCLQALADSNLGKYTIEVIVVDNASTDGSVAFFQQANLKLPNHGKFTFVSNMHNLGFAAGNNRGIRQASGRYILLLNSDVMVEQETLHKMVAFMDEHPEYGVSTCKLVLPSANLKHPTASVGPENTKSHGQNTKYGALDPACHRGEPTLWNSFCYFVGLEKILGKTLWFGGYHQGWKDLNAVHAVLAISGAFFMLRKAVIDQVGLLDEGFFMYAEDLDWCKRIHDAGFEIGFNPTVTALHLKGVSGRRSEKLATKKLESTQKTEYYFWFTMGQYYEKHYRNQYPKVVMWMVKKVIQWKTHQTFHRS